MDYVFVKDSEGYVFKKLESEITSDEKVISEKGDYGRVYDDLYEAIKNGKEKTIKDEEIICQIKILEEGSKDLK